MIVRMSFSAAAVVSDTDMSSSQMRCGRKLSSFWKILHSRLPRCLMYVVYLHVAVLLQLVIYYPCANRGYCFRLIYLSVRDAFCARNSFQNFQPTQTSSNKISC